MEDREENSGQLGLAGIGIALGGLALGAFLATRRQDHDVYGDDAPGSTARRSFGKYAVTGRTVTIRKPRTELFGFWRDFTNLPSVMENLDEVVLKSTDRSVWKVKAPGGRSVDIETEVVREVANELIAWRSLDGSDIDTEGRVTFTDAPGDRGTRVSLIIAYKPPAGALGRGVAKLFLREPEIQARHDLKRFKMLMETGEIATSARRKDQTRQAKMENA